MLTEHPDHRVLTTPTRSPFRSMPHMDISYWAFIKLSDPKWGVIATEWRTVDCGYTPTKQAVAPSWIDKKEWINNWKPWGYSSSNDRRRNFFHG